MKLRLFSILCLITLYLKSIICFHFDFSQNHIRCFVEEFLHDSHVGITYKVWAKENKNKEHIDTQIVPRIQIAIVNEENQVLHLEKLKSSSNKFSYINKKEGYYLVCAEYFSGWRPDGEALMKINFISENQEEPNILDAIKEQDLDPIKRQINEVVHKGKNIIKSQQEELEMEDYNAMRQMHIASYCYRVTICQIVAFILLGIYQAFSFRKILN